jgi:hypothetical protein
VNFPNVFADGHVEYDELFRRFTVEEVDRIERKIRQTGTLIHLPFVHRALASRFDLRGMKPPFWFIPFVAFGNDRGGVLYFEENGIYTNYESPTKLGSTGHCDKWVEVSVDIGYNGLNDDESDDECLSALCIEARRRDGSLGEFNIVEFHGEGFGATLRILLAIWETAWQPVVERSRQSSAFMKGPPPWPEFFESWDALLAWAGEGDEPKPTRSFLRN